MLPSRMHCKLCGGADHTASALGMGQWNRCSCTHVAVCYQGKTCSTTLTLCSAVTKYSVHFHLNWNHNEGQEAPGSVHFKCQILAMPPSFLSLGGLLWCKVLSNDCSCRKDSAKPKSCSSMFVKNRPTKTKTPQTPSKFLKLAKSYSRQKKTEDYLSREINLSTILVRCFSLVHCFPGW